MMSISYQQAADEVYGAGRVQIDEAAISEIGTAAKGKFELSVDAAVSRIQKFAPLAPEATRDLAALLLIGYLHDCPPADKDAAFRLSGARALLLPFREHRAGKVGTGASSPMSADEMMRKA